MGDGQNVPAPTGDFSYFFSQNCIFPEESFILISFCYCVEYVANIVNSQHWLILVAQNLPVLWIRMFLGLLDPQPDPDLNPFIIKQK
jgi:hypothetical protein